MAWTSPRTWVAGELETAAIFNPHVRDNLAALRDGGIAIVSQGANEIIFASSSTQLSRSANLTFNGTVLSVTGLGTHQFVTDGAGAQILRVSNTTAGTGNYAEVSVIRNGTVGVFLQAFSSTYTSTAVNIQGGATINSDGVGGLSIAATHASGGMRFFAGGTTERMAISSAGVFSVSTLGAHSFSAGAAGSNILRISNTSAGTANLAELSATRDGTVGVFLQAFSSTYTTSNQKVQGGAALDSDGVGGLSLAASHGSGTLRLYAGGSTVRVTIDTAGAVQFHAYTATTFVAGDKYLVVDANGNIHVSAVGPAS